MGRGLLLWLIGIPIPIILLIWLLGGCTARRHQHRADVGHRFSLARVIGHAQRIGCSSER